MNVIQKSQCIKSGLRKGFQDGNSKMVRRKCYGYADMNICLRLSFYHVIYLENPLDVSDLPKNPSRGGLEKQISFRKRKEV